MSKANERTRRFRHSLNGRSQILFNAARQRAQQKGLEFSLTREWLDPKVAAGRCEVTGILFDFGPAIEGLKNPFSPSLDRIDSSRGYTPDNTRVVCTIANYAKNEWGDSAVSYFALKFLENYLVKEGQCRAA